MNDETALQARTREVAFLSDELSQARAEVHRLRQRLALVEQDRDAHQSERRRGNQRIEALERGLLVERERTEDERRGARYLAVRVAHLERLVAEQPDPELIAPAGYADAWGVLRSDRAPLSIWRHAEGEVVVVTRVERGVVKHDGEWSDLITYVAQSDRREWKRPIDNFVARFALVLV